MTDRKPIYTGDEACPKCYGWGGWNGDGTPAYADEAEASKCNGCAGTGHRDPAAEMARLQELILGHEVVLVYTQRCVEAAEAERDAARKALERLDDWATMGAGLGRPRSDELRAQVRAALEA